MLKHEEVSETIIQNIKNGVYKANSKIPSENELASMFQTSRVTIRKGINNAINRGYLYSNQGKGTFVVDNSNKMEIEIDNLDGLTKKAVKRGKQANTKVLSFQFIQIEKYLKDIFKGTSDQIFYYERVRYIDDLPIAYEFAYMNPKYIKDISLIDISSSLDTYVESKGIKIKNITREFKATLPPTEVFKMLNLEANTPVIKVDYYKYLENGDILEFAKVYYNQNLFKFVQHVDV